MVSKKGLPKTKRGLPKIKKTISAFLSNEEGKILKKSIISAGSVFGSIAIMKLMSDIIPQVEACSHSRHMNITKTDTFTATNYNAGMCKIEAVHNLHTSHAFSSS